MKKIIAVIAFVSSVLLPNAKAQTGWNIVAPPVMWHFYSVDFVDANHGFACGQSTIIGTSNGKDWKELPCNFNNKLYSISAITPTCAVAVGRDGGILRTTDAGASWQVQTGARVNPLKAVSFVDTLTGWASGWYGMILHTTDGGANWIKQTSGTTVFFNAMVAINATTAYAVGEHGAIVRTIDSGNHWSIMLSETADSLYGICKAGKHIY
ncbi:MAG TPA: YCF48-related protein, partial [Candidatus Kapabacteria bacterium]|nr:YCF48-related protein [Candidatus Kapabacteria bacterium]